MKYLRSLAAAIFILASAVVWAPLALADEEPARRPPPGFEALPGAEQRAETVDASALVVGAYASIFGLLFGFVIHVAKKQSEISRELAELAEKITKVKDR